jgi:predicted RecB family nuclease
MTDLCLNAPDPRTAGRSRTYTASASEATLVLTASDPATKRRILDYNEDDCIAMRVVLDRMRGMGTGP